MKTIAQLPEHLQPAARDLVRRRLQLPGRPWRPMPDLGDRDTRCLPAVAEDAPRGPGLLHCGHPDTPDNLEYLPDGIVICRTC